MTDITPYLNHPDILNETAKQVVKDCGMSGLEIKVVPHPGLTYDELFSAIRPVVEALLKKDPQHFFRLMYRIDISEEQIKKETSLAVDKTFAEVVTGLILKRELLKVVIRRSYSAGKEL